MAIDPVTHRLWIDAHQQPGSVLICRLAAGIVGMPGRVESQPCPRRDADVVTWNHAEHHRAGGKTRAVDDYVLTRAAQRVEFVEIGADLTAWIRSDADGRGCWQRARRRDRRGQQGRWCSHEFSLPRHPARNLATAFGGGCEASPTLNSNMQFM